MSEHCEKSTRELGVQIDVDNSTVWRLLHEQLLHPYYVQRVHTTLPNDFAPRVIICQWFLEKCADPNFLLTVLFSDEA